MSHVAPNQPRPSYDERLCLKHALAKGLPLTSSWEQIEAHDAGKRLNDAAREDARLRAKHADERVQPRSPTPPRAPARPARACTPTRTRTRDRGILS